MNEATNPLERGLEVTQLTFRPARVSWTLAIVAFLLVCASFGAQVIRYTTGHDRLFGLSGMFNLDLESNIPALFSVVLLLMAASLLSLITMLQKKNASRDVLKWAILCLGFWVMAIDESVSMHELLIEPVREWLGGERLGIFYFAWVVPAIALVLVLGIYFLPFLLRLPSRIRLLFITAAVLYLSGALGTELIEGRFREALGHKNLGYNAIVSLEEGLEMAGVIFFIYALLVYIARHHGDVRFHVSEG